MDDRPDPISQFFPEVEPEDVNLYTVLCVETSATSDEIKKAYRKLALIHHPDKHATAGEAAKVDASLKFQQVGFAFSVLGDEKRRERYDKTGRTDEGAEFGPGEDGWEAYFEDLFEQVTKEKLDEMKKEYQGILDLHSLTAFTDCHLRPGSEEELEDLKVAYAEADGSIEIIMQHIPHSTFDDEARFIVIISDLINKGKLPSLKTWESSVKDEKARLVRRKQSDKEAKEAEELAKELGVWDEFYGSGKASAKKSKGKGKGKGKATEEEEDHSALQALILKRKKNREGFFDNLAAKYAEPDPSTKGKNRKGKKRSVADEEAEEEAPPPKKKAKKDPPENMDIDDEEFEALQQRLFGDKAKRTASGPSTPAKGKNTRSKRAR